VTSISYLLDINVLLALLDPMHTFHEAAHAWFADAGCGAWVTCPLTENGVIRIASHKSYPNSPGTPAAVAALFGKFLNAAGHMFWSDDLSLLNSSLIAIERLGASGQVTDTYLLALAAKHEGKLATFDRRLMTGAVSKGKQHLELIR
jgi:toxin-antitoxin system PIN domain toxin